MTADLSSLRTLPLKAADYIEAHGWIQAVEQDNEGRVCLTGALRYCNPQPGDFRLAREVYRKRDRAESWNDADGRTVAEVLAELRREITDADLEATFGPQWLAVVALVRRAATLTLHERRELDAARDAARDAAWNAARDAAWNAAWDAAWNAAWDAAWNAAWDAARDAAWDAARTAAWDAARDAARALATRDLIGTSGYTQAHYDLLTRPWASVIGPVHPDDAPVAVAVSA